MKTSASLAYNDRDMGGARGMTRIRQVTLSVWAILAIAVLPAAAQGLELGREAFDDGEYLTALGVLEPLAHEGAPEAQFLIGEMFLHGYGIPRDPIEAARLIRSAAKQGHAEAQFALSGLHSVGLGVKKDARLAAQWNLKAAKQGHGEAQLQMGYRCDLGDGVQTDHEQAASWYVAAAENGAVDSNVGLAYCSGNGLEEDLVAGYFWLSVYLASNSADESIREVLSFCSAEMSPEEIERARAMFTEWLSETAEE